MASQSQRTSASDLEMKRKLNYDATLNSAMASFGGYVADEEAEIAPSSQVKSSKKKRKKNKKEKRRHSQIAAGDNEEEQGTQATLASSPSSRTEKRRSSTPNEDEDEDHIEVTPTPPTKRRRKSSSEKAARRNIDNDGYDATEEETEAEKKRALVNTINRPLTPTQAGDSTGTEHHGETPIRPPPRNHLTNQKHNGTTKVNRKRASRKAKIQHEKIGNGNGITSDADSMRTKLSSSISNDMFARPLARRVAFDSGLAKPMALLAIRGREAVDDEWEETAGKIRGLVHTSGDAEAEESESPSPPLPPFFFSLMKPRYRILSPISRGNSKYNHHLWQHHSQDAHAFRWHDQ